MAVVWIKINLTIIGKFIKKTNTPTPLSMPTYLSYAHTHSHRQPNHQRKFLRAKLIERLKVAAGLISLLIFEKLWS